MSQGNFMQKIAVFSAFIPAVILFPIVWLLANQTFWIVMGSVFIAFVTIFAKFLQMFTVMVLATSYMADRKYG